MPGAATLQAHHWAGLGLAWLLGHGLVQQQAQLAGPGVYLGLAPLAVGLWLLRTRRGPRLGLLQMLLALTLLAYAHAGLRAELRLAERLDPAWEGRDLQLRGRIASLPQPLLGHGGVPGWRFEFELEAARDPVPGALAPRLGQALPRRLLLSWYAQPGHALAAFRAGERWQLLARLRQPSGLLNPQGQDYELQLFEQGLRATGLVRPQGLQRLAAGPDWLIDGWRQDLRDAIHARVPDASAAGVIAGLSLGDQAAIRAEDWALFRATGVIHLMSISGLHITMFAWAAAALLGGLWRRWPAACLRLPAPSVALWGGAAAALVYALFSGWGVPAQRTVWMLLALALLRHSGLRWPWPLTLLACACLVVTLDPWALLQPGFWLSFAAVALLFAGDPQPRAGLPDQALALLRHQWALGLGLAPLSLLFFQQFSAIGLLANLLAIPWVSWLLTPLALLGALLPWAWDLAAWALQGLMAVLRVFAAWPGGLWQLPATPLWLLPLGLLGALLAALPWPWLLRAGGLLMLLPLLWPAPARLPPGVLAVLVADVGQGGAVLLRTRHHSLLYDAGPRYTPLADAGSRVLLPLLRAQGVQRLDRLLLSHRDQDHVGGAASLLKGLPVAVLQGSLEPGHALWAPGRPLQRCERGRSWVWDGVRFELLHPDAQDYGSAARPNALSCVLRVEAQGRVLLLTGDIEAAQEALLLQRLSAAALRAEWLLLPHHGSQSSSSPAFLAAVQPRLALAQAGYRNRFGHPALPVRQRLQAQGIALLSSADCGAWAWRSDRAEGVCERVQSRRYWHRAPPPLEPPLAGPPLPDQDAGEAPR